jgi:hypothetical protein
MKTEAELQMYFWTYLARHSEDFDGLERFIENYLIDNNLEDFPPIIIGELS